MYHETYTGHCPHLESEHEISVSFTVNQFIGSNVVNGVPTSFQCDYQEQCKYAQQCPVFEACKNEEHILP